MSQSGYYTTHVPLYLYRKLLKVMNSLKKTFQPKLITKTTKTPLHIKKRVNHTRVYVPFCSTPAPILGFLTSKRSS